MGSALCLSLMTPFDLQLLSTSKISCQSSLIPPLMIWFVLDFRLKVYGMPEGLGEILYESP